MSTGLGLGLFVFAMLFVAGVVYLGRGQHGSERPAFVVGALSIVLSGFTALFVSMLFARGAGRLVSPLVCASDETLETVIAERVVNGRRQESGTLHCNGPRGRRPSTYLAPFAVFFDAGLLLFSAAGAVMVVALKRRRRAA